MKIFVEVITSSLFLYVVVDSNEVTCYSMWKEGVWKFCDYYYYYSIYGIR